MARILNGWQRLWIVLSLLYLVGVITFDVMIWPRATHIEKRFVNDTYQLIDEAEGKDEKYRFSDIVEEANKRGLLDEPENEKEELMAAESWVQLAERAISMHKDKIDFWEPKNKYKREVRNINTERKEILLFSALFWFIPVIALYLLGLSVRWIIRGFRDSGNA